MISNNISPYKLSRNDYFRDEDGDSYKIIRKSMLENRVLLLVEDINGNQFQLSYEANDYAEIISEDTFNNLKLFKSSGIKSHVIYLVPSNSKIISDIKYLQPNGKFKYTQQTAELFTLAEAQSIIDNFNRRDKENIYKYGIR